MNRMSLRSGQISIKEGLTAGLLKQLIRIPSVNPAINPTDNEIEIASFIARWLRKTRRFHVMEQKVSKGRFNVVAVLDGKEDGRSLMLNGHMDTVGVTNMTIAPFHPILEHGRIHGRGACDMKGSLAAMMSAMLALSNSKTLLAGDVMFAAVVDEEYKSIGTSELVKRFRADAAIVGEPTGMNIAIAQKGYAWLEIETIGRRAHGSVPEEGIDAIEKMAKVISKLDYVRNKHRSMRHRLVGTPRIHTSTVTGGSDWSTVPASCTLRIERRLIPGESPQSARAELQELVRHCSREDRKLKAKVRIIHHAKAFEIEPNERLVSILHRNLRRIGAPGRIVGVPYWTDAAILVNDAKIPTCLFGPGDIRVAHSPDEYVATRDVLRAARVYAETARQYHAS